MQHLTTLIDHVEGRAPQASRARAYRYGELWAGAALTVVGFASLAWIGRSSPVASQYMTRAPYCEAVREGLFAQPVNTLSNATYCLSGLLILYLIGRDRTHGKRSNDKGFLAPLFGLVAILLGLTSAAFHGTLTHWGGIADNLAMNLLVSFVLVHNIVRLEGWTTQVFVGLYASLNAATTMYLLHDDRSSLQLFAVLVAATILSECMVLAPNWLPGARHRRIRRRSGNLAHAAASFGAGFGIWRLSDTTGPFCAPDRLFQGHAVWHLFTSLTILFLYLYLRSEGAPRVRINVPTCSEAKLGVNVRLV